MRSSSSAASYRSTPLLRRPWLQVSSYALAALLIVGATGLFYRKLWPSYADFSRSVDPSCMVEYCDFTLFYYKQAKIIRHEDTPLKKYFYSPSFALMLEPLGELPKASAQAAWTWVQAASLLLLVVASVLSLRGFSPGMHALLLALTLTCYPVLHNWKWGQANTTFVALVLLSVALLERGWLVSSALALALVVACRYYPAAYALIFVTRERRSALVWFGSACMLLLVVWPALAMGAEQALHFYRESQHAMAQANSTWVISISSSQYLPSTAARLARSWRIADIGSRTMWASAAGALALCNLVLAWFAIHKRMAQHTLWAFSYIALSTPLLLPTSWMHYFVYLPLIQTFTLGQLLRVPHKRWLRALCAVLLWAPSVALSSILFFLRIANPGQFARSGYLLHANLLLLGLVYVLFALQARRSRETTGAAGRHASVRLPS